MTQAAGRLPAYHSFYEQLPLTDSQTRVLALHPPSSNGTLESCSLEVITLAPEPSKAYVALSYVWGDASVTKDIIVNGVTLAVTSNLMSALRDIRKTFGKVLVWADAVCMYLGDTPRGSTADHLV